MKAQEIANLSGGSTLVEFYSMADSLTTAPCFPIRITGGCFCLMSAVQPYKVPPSRMKAMEVGDLSGGSTLAEFYSMADSSTSVTGIPILFAGRCWIDASITPI